MKKQKEGLMSKLMRDSRKEEKSNLNRLEKRKIKKQEMFQ